ncbi:MAG: alpha-galactosidase, partial [Clostridia bacterium]|nr:alpha-galactosidase [Clostridia bacterium]
MYQRTKTPAFRNIYLSERGGNKYFCYRTGMTVYEEVFDGSRYMSAGWNSAGYTLNVLDDMPTRIDNGLFTEAQAFDLEADGVSLAWDFAYVDFSQSEETLENGTVVTHGVVTLRNRLKPILAKVHTVLDGTALFTRYIEVVNEGDAPVNINVAAPMCGGIETVQNWQNYMNGVPDQSKIYSLGYMSHAAHLHEGYFKWHDLPNMTYSIDGKYRYDRFRHPMFFLRNNLLGHMLVAQMGWTGGYRFDFSLDTDNKRMSVAALSFRMEMMGQKPFVILAKGESFTTPSVHIGMVHGDLDDAVNAMHKHIRKSVFTLPAARGVKGWIEGGMGPERLMDVRATKHFADTMAEVGAETLIIDAGWYCPPGTAVKEWHPRTGDWYPHPDRYPNGIAEIRDYIHSKGLLFGLWLDLERLGKLSKAAVEHPEWISKCYINGKENSQLNMAIPEAAAFAERELSRVIEEYRIDIFRLDYNLDNRQLQNRYYGENGVENA